MIIICYSVRNSDNWSGKTPDGQVLMPGVPGRAEFDLQLWKEFNAVETYETPENWATDALVNGGVCDSEFF